MSRPSIDPRARRHEQPGEVPALRVAGVEVWFGAFQALSAVDLVAWPGEVVGVIGPNGAGKSTLVNALAGVVRPRCGTVSLGMRELRRQRPSRRARLGLMRTFQTAAVFGSLPVSDNLRLAPRPSAGRKREGLAELIPPQLGLESILDTPADRLSGGQRKLVELCRATSADSDVLLLDEPVAGVPYEDRVRVLDLLRAHVDERHSAVLLIEHDMEFVAGICDWIYVMAAGAVIAQGGWEAIRADRDVLDAYLGTAEAPGS